MLIFRFSRVSGRFEIAGVSGTVEPSKGAFRPAVDVSYYDHAFMVRMDVPGIDAENLLIEAGENEIRITGTVPSPERSGPCRLMERSSGAFRRTIGFSSRIASDQVEARLLNGVLTIIVPAPDTIQNPTRIDVQIEGAD